MNLAELSNQTVSDLRLRDVTCEPKRISSSVWKDCRIECREHVSDLGGTQFLDCCFTDSYFGNAPLKLAGSLFRNCTLRRVTFMYGQLVGVRFENSTLDECHLRSADLRNAIFETCRIRKCNLEKADLHGSHFPDTELEDMDFWGWHGYAGAEIADEQKFKFFIATDPAPRLRQMAAREASGSLEPFLRQLESSGFGTGEVMLKYEEWQDVISFSDFVRIGKLLTE